MQIAQKLNIEKSHTYALFQYDQLDFLVQIWYNIIKERGCYYEEVYC